MLDMRHLRIDLDAITRDDSNSDDEDDGTDNSNNNRRNNNNNNNDDRRDHNDDDNSSSSRGARGVLTKSRREGLCAEGVRVGSLLISAHGLRTSTGSSYVLSLHDLHFLPAAEGGFLGSGSSGAVRRAVHRHTGQVVAVKEIKYTSAAHLSEIRRELETLHGHTVLASTTTTAATVAHGSSGSDDDDDAAAAATVDNDNNNNTTTTTTTTSALCSSLVDFYGAFCYEGSVFIAMECLDASLDSLHCAVPHDVLACITRRVLHGLVYLHRVRHLIHRDLKPSNVLVRYDTGDVKISDFGVSSQLECTKGGAHSFVGTVTYMSPERLKGDVYSYAADVWSLGLVVAELALGVCPFAWLRGDSTEARFWALLQHLSRSHAPALTLPDTLERHCAQFILACMHKAPEQRPTCVALLSHPFIAMHCGDAGGDEAAAAAADRATIRRWLCSRRNNNSDNNNSSSTATPRVRSDAAVSVHQSNDSTTSHTRSEHSSSSSNGHRHGSRHGNNRNHSSSNNVAAAAAHDVVVTPYTSACRGDGDSSRCDDAPNVTHTTACAAAADTHAAADVDNDDDNVTAAAVVATHAPLPPPPPLLSSSVTWCAHTTAPDASPLNLDDELNKLLL